MATPVLATIRKAACLSQTVLSQRVGIGRHAVSYWECKLDVDLRSWAVRCMAEVLPLPDFATQYAREGGRGVSPFAALDAMAERKLAEAMARAAGRAARLRVRCGARTGKGTPCRNLNEPGKRRCKFHGGVTCFPMLDHPEGPFRGSGQCGRQPICETEPAPPTGDVGQFRNARFPLGRMRFP